jgi:predicted GNAT family acetyltransferase
VFLHASIEPGFEGRGLGGRLAETAQQATREESLRVAAQCGFLAAYIERHPENANLVEPMADG